MPDQEVELEPIRPSEMETDSPLPAGASADAALHRPPKLPDGVLSDITHLLVSEDSPDHVLAAVAQALAEVVPHDTLTLYSADEALGVLRPVLVLDRYADEILAEGPVPFGRGITGAAAQTRIPQLVNDVHLDPRAHQVSNTPVQAESLLAIPLLAREKLKGVLCLYRLGEGNRFSIREFKLSIVFGELAALAMDNAQIRERLEAEVVTDHLTALYNHRYFHERLAEELRRASRLRTNVGLLVYDIDDFKRVNDTHGHLVGDQVLQGVASISRETCRAEDVLCRIGGEEFAVILPGCSLQEARALADRLRVGVATVDFPSVGTLTVSVGVAEGPVHASSPRELVACADLAMLEAKRHGKNRVHVFGAGGSANGRGSRPGLPLGNRELRSVAHLRMLQSLSLKLSQMNDVAQIGSVITEELRGLIDYHNCRVHLLSADGKILVPVAFRGTLMEYQGETFEALVTQMGEGMTGRVALTGRSHYTPNANEDPYAVTIPGTMDMDESILVVPLKVGERTIGTVALSKLGIDQFDEEDMRLLEALASNAAVAFENARLLQREREAAEVSGALLTLSQGLTARSGTEQVLEEALRAMVSLLPASAVGAWVRDRENGDFHIAGHQGLDHTQVHRSQVIPRRLAEVILGTVPQPLVVPADVLDGIPEPFPVPGEPRPVLIAPMRWDPEGMAFLLVTARGAATFSDRDLRLARGIADITSLALGNASRFVQLEEAYVSTVEALANALEAKDEYTEDHCRALAELSMAVGAELGLEGDELKRLELGALFHDIGKIGIPSEIIRKPAPLTAAERREMQRHTIIGEQILAPVPFLQPIRPIIRASHERWDGKGYPDRLSGTRIPMESRIIFVCDAFHAMATDRPYRAALREGEALRRLKLSAGTQFDPAVVDAFVRVHESGGIHFRRFHDQTSPGPGETR